jgi:hypothetical protein
MLYPALVNSDEELRQIHQLQQFYLKGKNIPTFEKELGFLTVHHSFEMLFQIHSFSPSVIIKDEIKVFAYSHVMTGESRDVIPVLKPMFKKFEEVRYKNKFLNSYRFYVMGQICIAKE